MDDQQQPWLKALSDAGTQAGIRQSDMQPVATPAVQPAPLAEPAPIPQSAPAAQPEPTVAPEPLQPAPDERSFGGMHYRGIFGDSSALAVRFESDYDRLQKIAEACHTLGLRIVLTSGTFDILHIGHAKYLERAKSFGDILIVGVDSDIKVRDRKGPDRPVVPEMERVEMLTHLRSVDLVTLKTPAHEKWELQRRVRPDTLIATEGTYSPDQVAALKEFCGDVQVLEPQAVTSTTARLRRMRLNFTKELAPAIADLLQRLANEA